MQQVRTALHQKRLLRSAAPAYAYVPGISDDDEDYYGDEDQDRVDPRTLARPSTPEPCEAEYAQSQRPDAAPAPVLANEKASTRCGECRGKLTGLQRLMPCRCGRTYCAAHRIDHACQFSYR
jgi:hypothetical protein